MDVREKLSNEKRLIDADRAMEIVRNQGIAHPNAYHLTNYATLILREAPTVDAVHVVRCAQCKHFKRNLENDTYCSSVNGLTDPQEDDFCSYGERSADDADD